MSSTAEVRSTKEARAYSGFCPSVTAGGCDEAMSLTAPATLPTADCSSLGMIQTLFDSPCAISGSVWRYWYASSSASGLPSWMAPKTVSIERLMAGVETSQRVEITGLVRAVSYVASQKTMIEVSVGGYRVRVFPKLPPDVNPRSLVAAKVRVRGTATSAFNYARRQLTAVNIMVPTAEEFVVEEPEQHPPWAP